MANSFRLTHEAPVLFGGFMKLKHNVPSGNAEVTVV
jgi:hypothetical protein